MFGSRQRAARARIIEGLHAALVSASRSRALYGEDGLPDTVEGRFEALTLHAVLVLRRLRTLPSPADDIAQDLVDALFAHLEVALREIGIGDFGVPKRMKKLARAFYDRMSRYEAALAAGDPTRLADVAAGQLGLPSGTLEALGRYGLAADRALADYRLEELVEGAALARLSPDPVGERA